MMPLRIYRNILYDRENYTQNGMYVALLNDNSLKHIYTLSIICASFTDPVFLRVFRSVCSSPYQIIYSYTHCILVIRTL